MEKDKKEEKLTVLERLFDIQQKISVPKDQYNPFGKFCFRNAETILKAAKPLLKEHKCIIVMSDKLTEVGGNHYLEATATLRAIDLKGEDSSVTVAGLAREANSKKGMDDSQVTGATSSYARKYALCGLFAISDGVDNDAFNNKEDVPSPVTQPLDPRTAKKISDRGKMVGKIDFAEVRRELKSITEFTELVAYWRELKLSPAQEKYLMPDFTKRKEEINGMD